MLKIGTKVIVSYLSDSEGEIVTEPEEILGHIYYGIKFKNPIYNRYYNPRYIMDEYLVEV